MANLTSSLTVKLIDDVSKPARSVAQALKDAERAAQSVAKGMAGAGATDRFVANLSKLKLGAKDIETVAAAWRDYAKAQGLAADASTWTKTQTAGVRSWERQQIAAIRAVKQEQASFYKAQAAAMGGGGSRLGRLVGGAKDIAAGMLYGSVPLAAAFGTYELGKGAIHAGAERQHVRVGAMNAGLSPDELRRAEAASISATKGAPNLSASEVLELFKESRSAVQHPEETFHLIPSLAKAASVLKGMGVENANIADIVKGGESLGLMNDPKRFEKFLEGQVKAMQVMGKTISTEQVYEAAKYSKSAGATLSDRFLNTTLPSLIQEMHGSSAGDAMAMLVKTLRGGMQNKHIPVERLKELGLLADPSKITRSKTGSIKGYKGKVVGDDLLASDTDKWFQQVFKPAAEKAGYKTLSDQVRLLNQTLPSTAANLGRILIQQEETLKQHARNYGNAAGFDQAIANQRLDPKAGIQEFKASLEDLGAAVTTALPIAQGLSSIAQSIRDFAQTISDLKASASDLFANSPAAKAAREAEETAAREGRKVTVGDQAKAFWNQVRSAWTPSSGPSGGVNVADWQRDREAHKRIYEHPEMLRPASMITGVEGASPHLDVHEVDYAKASVIADANEMKQALSFTASPTVDVGGAEAALNGLLAKANAVKSVLASINSEAIQKASALRSLGSIQRGHFGFGGVQGE